MKYQGLAKDSFYKALKCFSFFKSLIISIIIFLAALSSVLSLQTILRHKRIIEYFYI